MNRDDFKKLLKEYDEYDDDYFEEDNFGEELDDLNEDFELEGAAEAANPLDEEFDVRRFEDELDGIDDVENYAEDELL